MWSLYEFKAPHTSNQYNYTCTYNYTCIYIYICTIVHVHVPLTGARSKATFRPIELEFTSAELPLNTWKSFKGSYDEHI